MKRYREYILKAKIKEKKFKPLHIKITHCIYKIINSE